MDAITFNNNNNAWNRFNILYKSPKISTAKEARYILIGEHHNRAWAKMDHAHLVDQTIDSDSVFALEGFSSLTELSAIDQLHALRCHLISDYAQKRIKSVIGWDTLNHMAIEKKKVFLCNNDPNSTIFIDEGKAFSVGDLASLLDEVKFLKKEVEFSKKDTHLPSELEEMQKNIINEAELELTKELAETFPERTLCMAQTLTALEERRLKDEIKGVIYLICGKAHVQQRPSDSDDSRFSLKPLYDVLEKLPSVVVSSKWNATERSPIEKAIDDCDE